MRESKIFSKFLNKKSLFAILGLVFVVLSVTLIFWFKNWSSADDSTQNYSGEISSTNSPENYSLNSLSLALSRDLNMDYETFEDAGLKAEEFTETIEEQIDFSYSDIWMVKDQIYIQTDSKNFDEARDLGLIPTESVSPYEDFEIDESQLHFMSVSDPDPIYTDSYYRGGYPYFYAEGQSGYRCTLGFSAFTYTHDVLLPTMLSAGHCHNNGWFLMFNAYDALTEDVGTWTFDNSRNNITLSYSFAGSTSNDSSLLSLYDPSEVSGNNYLAITRTNQPQIVTYGGTSTNTSHGKVGANPLNIYDYVTPIAGMPICKSGATSGWSCGLITTASSNITIGTGSSKVVLSAFSASMCVLGGDSGGPIVSGHYAVGITSAGNATSETTCAPIPTTIGFAYDLPNSNHDFLGNYPETSLNIYLGNPSFKSNTSTLSTSDTSLTASVDGNLDTTISFKLMNITGAPTSTVTQVNIKIDSNNNAIFNFGTLDPGNYSLTYYAATAPKSHPERSISSTTKTYNFTVAEGFSYPTITTNLSSNNLSHTISLTNDSLSLIDRVEVSLINPIGTITTKTLNSATKIVNTFSGLYASEYKITTKIISQAENVIFSHQTNTFSINKLTPGTSKNFTDISKLTTERQNSIKWVSKYKITGGCNTSKYCPNDPVNRGSMAVFLQKIAGIQSTTITKSTFADVKIDPNPNDKQTNFSVTYSGSSKATKVAYVSQSRLQAIEWLYKSGITGGAGTNNTGKITYKPSDPVNRGAMAQFLEKFSGHKNVPVAESQFPDVKVGSGNFSIKYTGDNKSTTVAKVSAARAGAINWLTSVNISGGSGSYNGVTTFKPQDAVNRGSMAVFLNRYGNLLKVTK